MTLGHARRVPTLLVGMLVVIGATLALVTSGATAAAKKPKATTAASSSRPVSASELALHDAMRKLWEDHITWTRNVIISLDADLPDLNAVIGRLLQNQTDIGNAIKPYYGEEAGDQLTALLREHIFGAAAVLTALKADDQPALEEALEAWYANAHDIAVFLSTANPKNWPLAEMDQMMRDHLDATTREALARHAGDWEGDIAAYDAVHVQILEMADMLSSGIVAQFPNLFRP